MSDHRYRTAKIYISLKHGETITKELHTQFKEGRNCDLEIRLDKRRLYVHKCLIDIFFIKAGAELEDERFFLDLTRYSQPVVEALIGLVYTGNLRCTLDQVENVYKAAAELGCVEAQTGCQTYLRDNGVPVVIAPVNTRDSSSSPGVPQIPYSAPPATPEVEPEIEPSIIVKTEPVDELDESRDTSSAEPAKQADQSTGRYNYRSTFLVPVSSSALPSYQYTMDSLVADGNLQQKARANAKFHPALPAPQSYKTSPKKVQVGIQSKKNDDSQNKSITGPGKGKERRPKVVVLGKDTADRIRSLSSLQNKYDDTNSLSQEESSVDTDDGEVGTLNQAGNKASGGLDSEDRNKEHTESAGQTVLEKYLESVPPIVKIERDMVDDTDDAVSSLLEDNIEAQKNEQMFSLGLAKKTDIKTNEREGSADNPGKRRLRTRKKVDYSRINIEKGDFDDSSDYDPLEDVIPKKKFKSHTATKGRNLKIDSTNLVTIDPHRKANKEPFKSQSAGYIDPEGTAFSPTIAVRQDGQSSDYDDGISTEEKVYFPPAGSVPHGVNSQYAQGTFLKVKYVTETLTDTDGNVTVISKRVPVRPRQFGLDERLMNRPAVYVCHPTAPVVKPVVRKNKR